MRYSVYVFLVLMQLSGYAQEVLTGLEFNPIVQQMAEKQRHLKNPRDGLDTVPMVLPFFDDFRENTVFPSETRWIDNFGFVNTDIPVFPVNRGVVTLDAISDSGQMYPNAVPGPTTFIADHLTSRFIRLDSLFTPEPRALTPADSVYLSFWYQPQGRGKPPHAADSLKLQFLLKPAWDSITPTDTTHVEATWQEVWGIQGLSLDTFYLKNNKYFVQVMIPIVDTHFFKKTFQFQFFNFVSLASSAEPSWQSNCSQWNLDEIYLNAGRSMTDSIRPEITFIDRPPSLLKRFSSMPYPQYTNDPTHEMTDTIDLLISNRTYANHNATYSYTMSLPSGSWEKEYNGGQYIIKPYFQFGYVTYIPFAHPPVQYFFPVNTNDSALFCVTHRITALDGSNLGDTMQSNQVFYNYYAYDDGTPDAGYGLTPAGSKLAYRFKINKLPDTLRAVQFYFNRTLSNNNIQFFYLTVWNDNNNKPGQILYEELVMPTFSDSLNQFVTYHLNPPVRLSTTFYVGWQQTTDDNLNVGYDRYNNHAEEILYNSIGTWESSSFIGSLMIRPIVGKPIPLSVPNREEEQERLRVYPNPASVEKIHIESPSGIDMNDHPMIHLYTLYGQEVYIAPFSSTLDISSLAKGLYLIAVSDGAGVTRATARLVITR